jgi:hypothetical protein
MFLHPVGSIEFFFLEGKTKGVRCPGRGQGFFVPAFPETVKFFEEFRQGSSRPCDQAQLHIFPVSFRIFCWLVKGGQGVVCDPVAGFFPYNGCEDLDLNLPPVITLLNVNPIVSVTPPGGKDQEVGLLFYGIKKRDKRHSQGPCPVLDPAPSFPEIQARDVGNDDAHILANICRIFEFGRIRDRTGFKSVTGIGYTGQ